jgi:hypothetical protein
MHKAMRYYPGHPDYVPPPPPTFQQQWRIDHGQDPNTLDFIKGVDDLDENGNPYPEGYNGMQYAANQPQAQSFNPQNQDVLDRAAAALDAIRQDRTNPMYGGQQSYAAPGANGQPIGGTSPIPGLIGRGLGAMSDGLNFAQDNIEQYHRDRPGVPQVPPAQRAGFAAPGQNAAIQGSPGLRGFINSVGQGLNGLVTSIGGSLSQMLQPSGGPRRQPMYGGAQGYAAPGANNPLYTYDGPNTPSTGNPMRPIPGGDPHIAALQAEIDRGNRQEDIMLEPGATSSGGATKNFRKIQPEDLNGVTAPTVAGYNGNVGYVADPNRASAERNIASSQANAQRLAEGGAAADPTNGRGRFGGAYGAGLDADATALAEGRAVRTADGKVVYFTGTQESARQAQTAGKAEREALRDRNNLNVPEAELKRRAAADAQAAARAAKHQAFKDANGGMSYKQYDRMTGSSNGNNALTMKAVREGRLSPMEANYRMQLRAEKALRRSGNPITGGTSMAGSLYPNMMPPQSSKAPAPENPMSAATDRFRPGGVVTPQSSQAARDTLKVMAEGGKTPDGAAIPPDPMFAAGLAESPDNIQGVHFGIQQMVQDGKDLGDNELQSLHAAAVAMQAGHGTSSYDPFDMTYGFEGLSGADAAHTETFGPMYKELAGMATPTPQQLRSWWAKFKGHIRPDTSMWSSVGEDAPSIGGTEFPRNPMKP